MVPRKITPMLILDYNHPLYDNWMSPFTDEGRDAFTRYVMECLKRYNGLGIIWELYNEVRSILIVLTIVAQLGSILATKS